VRDDWKKNVNQGIAAKNQNGPGGDAKERVVHDGKNLIITKSKDPVTGQDVYGFYAIPNSLDDLDSESGGKPQPFKNPLYVKVPKNSSIADVARLAQNFVNDDEDIRFESAKEIDDLANDRVPDNDSGGVPNVPATPEPEPKPKPKPKPNPEPEPEPNPEPESSEKPKTPTKPEDVNPRSARGRTLKKIKESKEYYDALEKTIKEDDGITVRRINQILKKIKNDMESPKPEGDVPQEQVDDEEMSREWDKFHLETLEKFEKLAEERRSPRSRRSPESDDSSRGRDERIEEQIQNQLEETEPTEVIEPAEIAAEVTEDTRKRLQETRKEYEDTLKEIEKQSVALLRRRIKNIKRDYVDPGFAAESNPDLTPQERADAKARADFGREFLERFEEALEDRLDRG
jgi:hypothetical protein